MIIERAQLREIIRVNINKFRQKDILPVLKMILEKVLTRLNRKLVSAAQNF